jgi:hydroxyacylglutathione hydrolase
MRRIFPDLLQTRAEHPIEQAPQVATHAYVLEMQERSVLIYSTGHADEHAAIEAHGGISHQLLSHRDEVGPALILIRELLGPRLVCHEREVEAVRGVAPVDVTLRGSEDWVAGLRAIFTPGHTGGSVCYLYDSPFGRRYLFTGDTVFWDASGWGAMALPSEGGSAAALRASLTALRPLEPDVVVSSASVGAHPFKLMGPGEWRAALDQAAASLEKAA